MYKNANKNTTKIQIHLLLNFRTRGRRWESPSPFTAPRPQLNNLQKEKQHAVYLNKDIAYTYKKEIPKYP